MNCCFVLIFLIFKSLYILEGLIIILFKIVIVIVFVLSRPRGEQSLVCCSVTTQLAHKESTKDTFLRLVGKNGSDVLVSFQVIMRFFVSF